MKTTNLSASDLKVGDVVRQPQWEGSRYKVAKIEGDTVWLSSSIGNLHDYAGITTWVLLDRRAAPSKNNFADFGIGDRVRLTDDNEGYCEAGAEGTVVESNYPPFVKVEFDKEFGGGRFWYTNANGSNLEKLNKPSKRFKLAWVFRGDDGEVTSLNAVGYGDTLASREEADASAVEILKEKDNYGMEIAVLEVRAFHRSKIEVVSEAA